MRTAKAYELFAQLFTYPGEDYRPHLERCVSALTELPPEATTPLAELRRSLEPLSLEELQELYTQTFDLNPACSLEVGWHLYGESYDRGHFLVKMRRELRRYGVAESAELPDHLSHVLALLGRTEPAEAAALAGLTLNALDRMRGGLDGRDNPFKKLLDSVTRWLESRYGRAAVNELADAPALRVLKGRGLP